MDVVKIITHCDYCGKSYPIVAWVLESKTIKGHYCTEECLEKQTEIDNNIANGRVEL